MFEKWRNTVLESRPAALFSRAGAILAPYLTQVEAFASPYWASASEWYEKREPREKVLLRILGVIVAVLFLYNFVYAPAVAIRQDLAEKIVTRQQDLADVHGMMRTYERLQRELASAEKRTIPSGRDFSLFSVVEQTLTSSVGRDRIGSITPADRAVPGGLTQYTVDVKLNNISLAQVVDALYGVQSLAIPVTVSNLQIRDHALNSHTYDVSMTCMAVGKHA